MDFCLQRRLDTNCWVWNENLSVYQKKKCRWGIKTSVCAKKSINISSYASATTVFCYEIYVKIYCAFKNHSWILINGYGSHESTLKFSSTVKWFKDLWLALAHNSWKWVKGIERMNLKMDQDQAIYYNRFRPTTSTVASPGSPMTTCEQ